MSITATNVMDEARLLLNDVAKAIYTDTVLLPSVKKAYRELQQNVQNYGGSVMREQSSALSLSAGATSITFTSSPALPSALLYPIQLQEKFPTDDASRYVDMAEREWVPATTQQERLRYWIWVGNEIRLVGATSAVDVRIRYWESLAELASVSSDILVLDSLTFLAARVAAIAAYSQGGSQQRASVFQADADKALDNLLNSVVKNMQGIAFRRPKFKAFRIRPFWRA